MRKTAEYVETGHAGVWPGGEPDNVRAAYDQAMAANPVPQQRAYSAKALLARPLPKGGAK